MNPKEKKVSSLFARALKRKQEWENKDEFLDVIYWMRQIMSIFIGLIWGIIPLQGYVGILLFLAVNVGIVYLYYTFYQQVDVEQYGGIWELIKEGMMTSSALFLITWIISYTLLRFG